MSVHPDDSLFSVNAPPVRTNRLRPVLETLPLVVVLAGCFVLFPLPWALQKLVGLVCGGLAALAVLAWTRPKESPEELLYRMRRVQHSDFGKQLLLNRPKPKQITIPGYGPVSARYVGASAAAVFMMVWWFTPWAPVGVRRAPVEDMTIPFGREIAAPVLAMPNGQMVVVMPPRVPPVAMEIARLIDDDAGPYQLGLRMIAEGKTEDALYCLHMASEEGVVEPAQAQLAQAQAQMFAGDFSGAAFNYEAALGTGADDPMILCQAAIAWLHAGNTSKSDSLVVRARASCEENDPPLAAVLHVTAALAVAEGKRYADASNQNLRTRELIPEDERSPLVAASVNNQAAVCLLQGQFHAAEELFKAAGARWEMLPPDTARTALAMSNLGVLGLEQARFAPARQRFEELLTASGTEGQPVAMPWVTLNASALCSIALCRFDEAEKATRETLQSVAAPSKADRAVMVPPLLAAAELRRIEGRYRQANSRLGRALAIANAEWHAQHPNIGVLLTSQAQLELDRGRPTEADATAKQAAEIMANAFGDEHVGVARAEVIRGVATIRQGRSRDARPYLERALAIEREILGKNHPEVAATMGYLASLDTSTATYPAGVDSYQKAIAIAKETVGEKHPLVARLMVGLARLHLERGKTAEAINLLPAALALAQQSLPAYHPELAATFDFYADVLAQASPPQRDKVDSLRQQAAAARAKLAQVDVND